ncbi:sodium:solute symporter [Rapidithrix thailandica]|uniref:Sodium:solute symporter n=1 Tax=Rapidithrix thailandica TaxID=413964 RepID=A0AAW9S609_9BACT
MGAQLVFFVIVTYFILVFLISFFTARGATTNTFFNADKGSPWYIVAFGMIGATLSGVTFISVPGWVGESGFSYFQMVLGYVVGYAVIATVLLPLYYKLNLISIYSYLEKRFGFWSYKTGAFFFLISRTIGAAFRLFLIAGVLQIFLFNELGISFGFTVLITIALIWLYTFRGGINTIVWTDTLQTAFMLSAVGLTIYIIIQDLGVDFNQAMVMIQDSNYAKVFFWEIGDKKYFFKQFLGGAFIAIVMTGLDQDMMQKNLTCRNLNDAQKNMYWFSFALVITKVCFLALGALLFMYATKNGIALPENGDDLYPMIAKSHLGMMAGVVFLLGVIAAAYSSADSALTSLTTSFCIDFLDFDKIKTGEAKKRMRRIQVHLMFSVLLFLLIMLFKAINNDSVIDQVFTVASYTYGPLLGLFSFGLFTNWKIKDLYVPYVCAVSPVICYLLNFFSESLFGEGFQFGYELLIINGALTFIGLALLIKKEKPSKAEVVISETGARGA